MKTYSHLLLLFTYLFFVYNAEAFQQETQSIENPQYEASNSGITHVSKIATNAQETRVTIHSKFVPGWWIDFSRETYLRDVDTDKRYKIKKVVGAEFDEKLWTPDSGEQFTALIFEPLPASAQKIDYVDAESTIFGISLSGKLSHKNKEIPNEVLTWIESEVARSEPALTSFDSDNFFSRKMGRVVGYLKGYDPRLGFDTGMIYIGNQLTREEYPTVVEIQSDGRFVVDIPLVHPTETFMVINKEFVNFYIEPGTALGLVLDWEEFLLADRYRDRRYELENIKYLGPLAKINEELSEFDLNRAKYNSRKEYEEYLKMTTTIEPLVYKDSVKAKYENNWNRLIQYLQEKNISTKAKELLQADVKILSSTHLLDFVSDRISQKRKDTTLEVSKTEIPESFYRDMYDLMPVNEPAALVRRSFSTLINRLEYVDPLMEVERSQSQLAYREPEITTLEYFEKEGIVLDEKYKEFYKSLNENKLDSLQRSKIGAELSEKYGRELQDYYYKYLQPSSNERAFAEMEKWRKKDSLLTNVFGIERNLASGIIKIRTLKFRFDHLDKEASLVYWDSLKTEIKNPFLRSEGQRMLEKTYPEIIQEAENELDGDMLTSKIASESALELPSGKATEAFRKITDPYKGKILFVDFWATWCGPCVGTIKSMKETRKKYKDNPDFAFIFITDDSSRSPKYEDFVKEQGLENAYRVDQSTYHRFRDLFSFNGIPQYIVLDKEGNVIDDDFKMHNFDYELPKILKAYGQ